ncbi:hypothetical protein ACE6H2_005102 [Prunus campanulata]
MSAPRSLTVPGRRERRTGKEAEPSASVKKSRHSSQVILGLSSPNVASASSTPSRQVPRAPSSSLSENDFTIITDDQMWSYQSNCLNALAGIRNAQMARFQAMSHEICEKTANLELSGKRIKEYEIELEQQRGELQSLRSGRSTAMMEVDRLKQDLMNASRNRDEEYQANNKQIRVEMARQFRYGWVQGQQLPEHRFVGDPDDYDDELEFDPAGYELFQGMHPNDRPPTDYIPHRRTPQAAFYGPAPSESVGIDVAPNASSIANTEPVLGFTGFTSPAGFSTCIGPTSGAVSNPLDNAP